MNMGIANCRISLNLSVVGRTDARDLEMNSPEQVSAQEITILLVEDDPPTLWRLQDALVKAGFEVRGRRARSARPAPRSPRASPRVLLTDLQLPDGHGVELIRETRARYPDTEIMVISVARRRGDRDLGDHRRRHRLYPQGRVPVRYRRHRARSRRRPFADLGLDRALHRAADPGAAPSRRRGRSSTPPN